MLRHVVALSVVCVGLASGQVTFPSPVRVPPPPGPEIPPTLTLPPIQLYADLKAALGLTDRQIEQLIQIQQTRFEAQRAVSLQIAQKQTALNLLLRQGTNDAFSVGRLMLDIEVLRKQLTPSVEPYRSSALALLNAEQRVRLAQLEAALKLQMAAGQAIALNLLAPPVAALPVIRTGTFFGEVPPPVFAGPAEQLPQEVVEVPPPDPAQP